MKTRTCFSQINGPLEISYQNGRKVLNNGKVNYSYGALQQVLHQGLRHISFGPQFQSILVLGAGGGSIVETVRDDFGSMAAMTLVEVDPEMIRLAKEEFDILSYPEVTLVHADAAAFAKSKGQTYDLVIVDIFIQDKIPALFTAKEFLADLTGLMAVDGRLIFNTLRSTLGSEAREQIISCLENGGLKIQTLKLVEFYNDLFIGRKQES